MTPIPQSDPLISLWQTAPQPDTQGLVRDLERLNRLHHRSNWIVLAIFCVTALLLVFEEATGRLASHGFLSVVWIAVISAGIVWHRRARCARLDALSLDTIRLLKAMIARAKKDLFVARCLYAGVPLGAAIGYIVSKLAGLGASAAAHPHLEIVQTAASVTLLLGMMVTGVILARARSTQVRDLNEKLRAMESDV